MQAMDDMALLREYAARDSEAAFAELVSRRVGFVHAAALRQVRDPQMAEEITQAVFIILAQKAGRISDKTNLTGWLFKTTRYAALAQMRAAAKRQRREQEAQMQSELQSTVRDTFWEQMSPMLDEALATLSEKDRQAVLLRFFENKNLAEVGNNLGAGEDTARKRVSRALEKLRKFFSKRGVVSTTAIIAGAMSANSLQAAPVLLAKSVSAVAIANGAAVSGSTLIIIKGALKSMAWTKAKTAIIVSAGLLLVTGTATVAVKTIQGHTAIQENTDYPWQVEEIHSDIVNQVETQVRIVPTKFSQFRGWGYSDRSANRKIIGIGAPIKEILQAAYGTRTSRTVFPSELPKERYDFIANLPTGSEQALQKEIERKLSFVGKKEKLQTDVLILTVKNPRASGLKPSAGRGSRDDSVIGPGNCSIPNQSLDGLADLLENYFEIPVIDHTGISDRFDIRLEWNEQEFRQNPAGLKQVLLNELGLEILPSREPIEMLVLEKVK